jgi:hypothetical protein
MSGDSGGARAMRDLAFRLKDYASTLDDMAGPTIRYPAGGGVIAAPRKAHPEACQAVSHTVGRAAWCRPGTIREAIMPEWVWWIAVGHAVAIIYMLHAVAKDVVAAIDRQTKAIEARR